MKEIRSSLEEEEEEVREALATLHREMTEYSTGSASDTDNQGRYPRRGAGER